MTAGSSRASWIDNGSAGKIRSEATVLFPPLTRGHCITSLENWLQWRRAVLVRSRLRVPPLASHRIFGALQCTRVPSLTSCRWRKFPRNIFEHSAGRMHLLCDTQKRRAGDPRASR